MVLGKKESKSYPFSIFSTQQGENTQWVLITNALKIFCKINLLNGASSNLIKSLAFSNMHYFHISPTICTVLDALSLPITLTAVHVYRVLPFSLVFLIRSELSVPIVYMSPLEIFCPSFVQVAVGVGTPLA